MSGESYAASTGRYGFKVGDVVRLRSGGPPMTVETIPYPGKRVFGCLWMSYGKPYRAEFKHDLLEKAK